MVPRQDLNPWPIITCVFPNASSSNWRFWFTSHFTASHCRTCATLPKFQADDDYNQQAPSSRRYPELGWLLSVTELSVLLDRGCGTVYRAMSLSDSQCFSVEYSNISFLVCLSLDIVCLFLFLQTYIQFLTAVVLNQNWKPIFFN